jgi:hypothetical protein
MRLLPAILALVVLAAGVRAETARELTWDDLVPPLPPLANPFEALTMEQRVLLHGILGTRSNVRLGLADENGPEQSRSRIDAAALEAQGVDVQRSVAEFHAVQREVERRNQAVVDGLDGQLVRLPGYALPLELSEDGVRELLLVPFVGACIHVPPPPLNQMVYVELDRPYVVPDLYQAVWVTGRMKVQRATKSLSLVDGSADVDAGYTLNATGIEPYKK